MKQDDISRVLNVSQRVVSRTLKEHRESGSIRKKKRSTYILECKELLQSIMVRGALSDDHLVQLKVVTGTLNSQNYKDQILESGVRPPLDSLDVQNMVLRDNISRPHFAPIFEEYKNQQNIASLPQPSLLPDCQTFNPIQHMWDKLS